MTGDWVARKNGRPRGTCKKVHTPHDALSVEERKTGREGKKKEKVPSAKRGELVKKRHCRGSVGREGGDFRDPLKSSARNVGEGRREKALEGNWFEVHAGNFLEGPE